MVGSILLVEDDELVRETLELILSREGHLVLLYRDGQEAIDLIEGGLKYNLALVDLSLPKRTGYEVIEVSRRVNPTTPIISMSGYFHKPPRVDRHIKKPVTNDDLLRMVGEFITRSQPPK